MALTSPSGGAAPLSPRARFRARTRLHHPDWSGGQVRQRVSEQMAQRSARLAGAQGAPTPAPTPGQPAEPQPSPFDYSADPVLQQIIAYNQKAIADAQASALAQRRQLLVDYGDPELVDDVLGQADPAYEQAARDNPFSILAQLRHGFEGAQTQTNEQLNKANLFYSSTRGKALGELGRAHEEQRYGASQQLQGQLGGISQALLGTRNQAAQDLAQGQSDAAQRAIDFALAYGINPAATAPAATTTTRRRRRRRY